MFKTLNCNSWEATFAPAHGGQLVRLRYLPLNRDILNYPESEQDFLTQPERFGIPVLFPPNRIAGGTFMWLGRAYSLPINEPSRNNHLHGIVLHEPWEMSLTEDATANANPEIELSFTHHQGRKTFAGYPHHFRLSIRYRFEETSVTQTTVLENLDSSDSPPMPFGLGFHTSFILPDVERSRMRLFITAEDNCYTLHPKTRTPTGQEVPWPLPHDYHTFGGQTYHIAPPISCHCRANSVSINGYNFRGALLDFPEEELRVRYEADRNFGFWFLWAPPDDPNALCIEPMTWLVNAPNSLIKPALSGLTQLDAGKCWQTETRLSLEALHAE